MERCLIVYLLHKPSQRWERAEVRAGQGVISACAHRFSPSCPAPIRTTTLSVSRLDLHPPLSVLASLRHGPPAHAMPLPWARPPGTGPPAR